MRKWLVGLLALACAAATSFAEGTATLPLEVKLTDKSTAWTSLPGFTAQGLGSIYANGNAKFDTTGDWMMVQFDSDPGELTFDVTGNTASGGEGTISFLVEESADGETWDPVDNLTDIATGTASKGPYTLAAASRYVRWTYANKVAMNIGLNNIGITSGGPAEFSVTFSKENWFKVALGEASSVTAIPKNGVEPYTFAWESDTPELNGGTTDTLEIPATLAEGDYTALCQVTDDNGEGDVINALIGFTVAAVPVLSGDTYTLVGSADDFEEGAEYLIVSYSKDKFTSALKNEANGSRIGVEEVKIADDNTVTTESDAIVWSIQAGGTEGQYVLFNEAKGVYAAGPKSEGNNAQLLSDGSDALAQWTLDFSELPAVAIGSVAYPERQLTRNSTATYEYFATYKGSGTKPYLFKKAGASGLSVTLDKANGFTVDLGTADSITATAKNGVEPYEYVWSSDTAELNGTGETLAIPATLAEGDYTVQVEVTDAESNKANKQIYFSVVAPAVKYAVNVAIGILNGGVTADKEEAEEGELVTLTGSPAAGYKLGTFLVDGEAIAGNTFNMPAHDVLVSAEFIVKPVVAGFTKITSLDELTEGEYVITGAKAAGEEYAMMASVSDGKTAYLQRREAAVELEEDVVTDAEDSIIWTLAQGADGWTIYNEAVGYAGYVAGGNSSGAEAEPSAKSSWTITASDSEGLFLLTNVGDTGRYLLYNASSPRFACYEKTTSGKQLALYKGSSGPAVPSVSLSASATEVEVNEPVTITATAKNFSAEVEWAWEGNDGGSADGAVYTVKTAVAGEFTIKATATAGDEIAEKSVTITVSEPAQKYAVNVAIGILNGGVTADKEEAEEGELVTLTGSPAAGYKLGTFLVDGEAIAGNTFNMPAHDVLVSAEFVEVTGEVYELVKSADDFEEGAEYLVVAVHAKGNFTSALKNEANGTRIGVEEVVVNEDNTVVTDDDSIVWTIQAGAEEGQYVLYNAAKGVYAAATKDDNVAQLLEDGTAALAQWTLKFDDAPVVGIWSVSYPERWLSRNSTATSAFFATYKGTQTAPYLFKKAGPASFTVTLDKADGFTVAEGSADSITATAKNGSGDYSYAWTGDLTGDAATLEIPATLAAGTYTVKVTATDNGADAQTAEKEISFSVVAPAAKYQIQVAIGIPNGSVSADKTEAEEGETVTLTATPDAGYKLEHFLVNDIAISANTFPMPAEDVLVSASFVEITGETYVRVESADDFEEGAEYLIVSFSKDKFTSALKNEPSDKRIAVEEVVIADDNTVTTDSDAIVWTISAGAEGKYTLYNAAKGVYAAAPTGASANEARLLEDGTDETAQWTIDIAEDALVTIGSLHEGKALQRNSTAANAYFANYKSGTKPFLFKKAGAPRPKIVYSGETTIALGGTFEIIFGLLNYDGDFTWEMGSREGGTIAQEGRDGLYTWTPTSAGDVTIKVVARSGGLDIATKDVVLTVTEPGPQPGDPAIVIDGPASGVVGTELSCTVTAINMADPAVYFEGNYGAPEGSTLTTDGIVFEDGVCTFTPDIAGEYWIEFCAYEGDAGICDKWTVTVTDVFQITDLKVTGGNLVLTFAGEGTPAVLGTASLVAEPQEWTPVEGAAVSGNSATVPMGAQNYIRLQ